MTISDTQAIQEGLKSLREDIPELIRLLEPGNLAELDLWADIIDYKLMPRFQADLPLLAAVCGGGSSGKSSLFNALVGESVSPVGGRAGMNRRVLLAAREAYFQRMDMLGSLFAPFGCPPEPLIGPQALIEPGCPLYVAADKIPEKLAVMDTPDFDTGAGGAYTNREAARQALESSDILVYIFTNANYANRDNTDFIARMLTRIGVRKCFLVYRVYPSFTQKEVLEHAGTVAENIYGRDADSHVLGIYRADEDNAVAAGERLLALKPARPGDPPFVEALNAIDARGLRLALHASIVQDVLRIAKEATEKAKISSKALQLYIDALQTLQGRCVREALRHFPLDLVVRRFADIWTSGDPPHIRFMRKTGAALEWPVKVLARAVGKSGSGGGGDRQIRDYAGSVKEDLIGAVHRLQMNVAGPEIRVSIPAADPVATRMQAAAALLQDSGAEAGLRIPGAHPKGESNEMEFVVPAHPAVRPEQEKINNRDWRIVLQEILSQKDVIVTLSESIENELQDLADDFRRQMGLLDKLRQSFSAFLNVLPATAAVTYILHTGDPAGAVGIKVKLTGLFGLKDLYALIAIPATSGLKKADQQQIESLLAPIAQTWFRHKVDAVQALFSSQLTGSAVQKAVAALDRSGALIQRIEVHTERISLQVQATGVSVLPDRTRGERAVETS